MNKNTRGGEGEEQEEGETNERRGREEGERVLYSKPMFG